MNIKVPISINSLLVSRLELQENLYYFYNCHQIFLSVNSIMHCGTGAGVLSSCGPISGRWRRCTCHHGPADGSDSQRGCGDTPSSCHSTLWLLLSHSCRLQSVRAAALAWSDTPLRWPRQRSAAHILGGSRRCYKGSSWFRFRLFDLTLWPHLMSELPVLYYAINRLLK